ncbi:hypothetical protein P692DRAFT_20880782 [Suillus brevipes Sb2]|nr:hypothetical protein P692DRAFT_20880782 [Suillus brevipes Sb2]
MVEQSIPAHVQHIKAESTECAASTKAGKLTVSPITDDLGHLTLLMNPSQPPSFASSMNNNLERPGPCNPPTVSVSALSNNLQQLKLSDGTSVPPLTTSRQAASKTAECQWRVQQPPGYAAWAHLIPTPCSKLQLIAQTRSAKSSYSFVWHAELSWGSDGSLSSSHENILKQIPLTSVDAEAKFHLTGKTITYAVCSCHCTYPPTYAPGSMTARYPEHCVHCPTPGTKCGDALLVGPEGEHHPKKTFMYHNFKDYLSGLLSHRDVEAVMDEACDDLMDSINSHLPPFVKNPFEAQFLRSFGGPEKKDVMPSPFTWISSILKG